MNRNYSLSFLLFTFNDNPSCEILKIIRAVMYVGSHDYKANVVFLISNILSDFYLLSFYLSWKYLLLACKSQNIS